MACSSTCPTPGSHVTLGECLRAKNINPIYVDHIKGLDYSREKAWNRELDSYAEARKQGIQPASTRQRDIEAAVAISDTTGTAFQADA